MASPAPPITDHKATELPLVELPTLTDLILEEIFLRLPTPADLARASTACPSFRRIITDRSFLRRFHALHPPSLLGFVSYDRNCFHPAQPPHPSAPMAAALAQAADFSYSFIPTGRWHMPWKPVDVRQGRVLLECLPDFTLADALNDNFFLRDLELAVCDPLFRRYVLLPPIPDDLTDQYERLFDFGIFLAPTVEDEETSFRVVCTAWNGTMLLAFVFSSITGQWSIGASPSWCSLGTGPPHFYHCFAYFDFARDCCYWTMAWIDKLLVLDAVRMEFSIVNNKPSGNLRQSSGEPHVAVGEEGTPLMLFISDQNEDVSGDHLHITKVNGSESSDQWKLENIIPLPRQYRYFINGAEEGFIFLNGFPEKDHKSVHPWEEYAFREYFTLDVRTSELQKVCEMKRHLFDVHAYFGFPPSLSKPCI